MKEYKTISGDTMAELDETVNLYLKGGWELYGNPYISRFGRFVQALTKDC